MAEISIVVPVYNVEKYLSKCIDSILNQTYKDLEIILVDDGSKDQSGKICDEYAKKDSRITVFHKENGGLSSARNYGIERATTPYIGFIDSDDYIDNDMYEILYNNIIKEDADVSMCELRNIYDGKVVGKQGEIKTFVANREEAMKFVMEGTSSAVNKLYKTSLFENMRFPVGKTSEDAFLIIELLLQIDKAVVTTAQKYNYIHRKGSITTYNFKQSDYDALDAYEKNYNIIAEKHPKLLPVVMMRWCLSHFFVLDKMCRAANFKDKAGRKRVVKFLRKNCWFIIKNKSFNTSRKIAMLLLMINVNLYKILARMQAKRLGI